MSTSIPTGFVVTPGADIHLLAKKTREVFLPLVRFQVHERFMEEVVTAYDRAFLNDDNAKIFRLEQNLADNYEIMPVDAVRAARKEMKDHFEQEPNKYQVKVGFAPDYVTGMMLGYFIGSNRNYKEFLAFDEVNGYHYQNSTEGPEDIPEEAWNERREVWNRVLNRGTVATEMMIYTVADPWDISPTWLNTKDAEKLGVELLSVEERIQRMARKLTIEEAFNQHFKDNPDAAHSSMKVYMDASRDTEKINEWAVEVEKTIDKNLSYDTFKA